MRTAMRACRALLLLSIATESSPSSAFIHPLSFYSRTCKARRGASCVYRSSGAHVSSKLQQVFGDRQMWQQHDISTLYRTKLARTGLRMYVWQPIRYAVIFTGGIALSTWVNARVNRRNERIRQQYLDSGLAKGGARSPELFMERIRAIHEVAALKSAIELGVFTQLGAFSRRKQGGMRSDGDGHASKKFTGATVPDMSRACGCSERGMKILLDGLTSLRFIIKSFPDGGGPQDAPIYRLTTSSAKYLDTASEACVTQVADWYFSDSFMDPLLKHLTAAVRAGTASAPDRLTLEQDDPRWVKVAKSFESAEKGTAAAVADVALEGYRNARDVSVLEVTAGHGMYGIECARRHRGATITTLGPRNVLEQVALPNAREAGIVSGGGVTAQGRAGERYSTQEGSPVLLETLGDQLYDIIIIPHVLHVLNGDGVRALLGKAKRALKPDGRCLIAEVVPNEERTDQSAAFSLLMLATTPGGDAYTLSELQDACADAGFEVSRRVPIASRAKRRSAPGGGWRSTIVEAFASTPKGYVMEKSVEADGARGPAIEEPTITKHIVRSGHKEGAEAEEEEEGTKTEVPETWAYPLSLGDFFSIFEGIVRSSLPGAGPEL